MLLLAVAVVFIGLGWHHAVTSGDDSKPRLSDSDASTVATAPAQPDASTGESSAPSSSRAVDAANVGSMCVLNAGTITGLAADVTKTLEAAGYEVASTSNLSTASISENTIFYTEGREAAAKKVAESVPGGASVDPRPSAFSTCPDEDLAVVVVSK